MYIYNERYNLPSDAKPFVSTMVHIAAVSSSFLGVGSNPIVG